MPLNEIFNEFKNISYEDIHTKYSKTFNKVLNKQENWLCPIEEKLHLLKNDDIKASFKRVISQLKENDYIFGETDIQSLGDFTRNIDYITRAGNFINNFRHQGKFNNGQAINLPHLFNELKNSKSFSDLINKLGGKIHPHLENLFAIVKHCQSPTDYPVNYPFWRNMAKEFFGATEDYDLLCEFYHTFPNEDRHLKFGVFLGTIATEIASRVNSSSMINSVEDKIYRRIYKLFHIKEYQDLILVSKTFREKILSDFEVWLSEEYLTNKDESLSEKSVKNYLDGIKAADSDIQELKIETQGLLSENGIKSIGHLTEAYQSTDKFKERDATGKGMYKNAILLFTTFISDPKNSPQTSNSVRTHNLNTILYGPPGTGKTYNTINKAIELIDGSVTSLSREQIKRRFDELVKEERIVFTTFHQSLSYEDFIEGLKPDTDSISGNNLSIRYKIVDGIFKLIAKKASLQEHKMIHLMGEKSELTKDIFQELYRNLSETLPDTKTQKSDIILETKEKNQFGLFRNSAGSIVVRPLMGKTDMSVSHRQLEAVLFDDKAPTYASYERPIINKILEGQNISSEKVDNTEKNYVLIIDEINRGNVSQIFGELITLIETDKRKPAHTIGTKATEYLEVMLPYSKTPFSVPDNLYIIGTMNTADRSVEALDSALRRRFVFEEMIPKPDKIAEIRKHKGLSEQIEGIDLGMLLRTINSRIEKLLDRDHAIGHSYFLDCGNIDDLKNTFYKNIIPLLQEYFYGDYAKIGLVLGSGFIKIREDKDVVFAAFGHENIDMFNERKLYEVIDHRTEEKYTIQIGNNSYPISFKEAIDLLFGKHIGVPKSNEE